MVTLPTNYQKNVDIMRENLKRGMSSSQAIGVVRNMRGQFVRAGLYGDTEIAFVNAMLAEISEYTHIEVTEL